MDTSKYISKVSGHALVLGGSGGIGVEVVRALVANGASAISLTYGRNSETAEQLKSELVAGGVRVHIGSVDLADMAAVSNFLEAAVVANGEEITVAVNCVGISPDTPYEEQTPELWRRVYDTNVIACEFSSRAIAFRMRAKGVKGSIVWITSTNGINSYSAFSAQIHSMLIAAEHFSQYGIRINGVAPGWIATKMNDTVLEEDMRKEFEKMWTKRMADPVEVAALVVFLAGSGSSYVLGQNLIVDGGYR